MDIKKLKTKLSRLSSLGKDGIELISEALDMYSEVIAKKENAEILFKIDESLSSDDGSGFVIHALGRIHVISDIEYLKDCLDCKDQQNPENFYINTICGECISFTNENLDSVVKTDEGICIECEEYGENVFIQEIKIK